MRRFAGLLPGLNSRLTSVITASLARGICRTAAGPKAEKIGVDDGLTSCLGVLSGFYFILRWAVASNDGGVSHCAVFCLASSDAFAPAFEAAWL